MLIHSRSRALSIGIASLGLLSLAGCAAESSAAAPATGDAATYADGTYSAEGSYQAPSGTESVTVTLTVSSGAVTAVTATGDATDREAQEFQQRFSSGISAEVVGQDLATLNVSRVAGSSLTSTGFNVALDDIRSQAG